MTADEDADRFAYFVTTGGILDDPVQEANKEAYNTVYQASEQC
jgi:hypothetical protein